MTTKTALADKLLEWYDTHHRELPWRAPLGKTADPYHVWLSEIMLQQTTVPTVKPYFKKFLEEWPTLHDLADADLDKILHRWQGLGYYARARNLHKCAKVLVETYNATFPQDCAELKKLPGIGDYTAAAIASIAFNKCVTVIDGNVDRVISRLYKIETPLPTSKPEIRLFAEQQTPCYRPGDYAQAMMDLGATICTPTSPKCLLCPLKEECQALQTGTPELYPIKQPKTAKPQKYGIAFWIQREGDSAVLLRKRPPKGLLGAMMEVPSSSWELEKPTIDHAQKESPLKCAYKETSKVAQHVFTHFALELQVYKATVPQETKAPKDCVWCSIEQFKDHALPTVFKKVIKQAL